jgi:N6-L-threonylcarbamoyladenine synthase
MTAVLGIETSCDETGVAVVADRRILADAVASSAALHRRYGGIVPEVAARQHVDALPALVAATLEDAGLQPRAVGAVAVTAGPGLVGSLLVGLTVAKALAVAWDRPLVAVHHLEAHLYANAADGAMRFPALALLVSGGHTVLWLWEAPGRYRILGETRDDAAGEALDKGARLLGLPYPGGPELERLAQGAKGAPAPLPVVRLVGDGRWDWSFSGLKTALARAIARQDRDRAEWALALQTAVVDALVGNVADAWQRYPVGDVYVAGGVAANAALRERLQAWAREAGVALHIPPRRYCTDNGAMVALAGEARWQAGLVSPLSLAPRPTWSLAEAGWIQEEGRSC